MFTHYTNEDVNNLGSAIKHHPGLGFIMTVVIIILNHVLVWLEKYRTAHIPPFIIESFQILMYISALGTFCLALYGFIERRIEAKKKKDIDESKID